LDVADVHQPGQRGDPEAGNRAAAGVEGEMVARAFVEPARRHDPGVFALEIALLRSGNGRLVPGVSLVDGIAERIGLNKRLSLLPVLIERAAKKDPQAEVDLHK